MARSVGIHPDAAAVVYVNVEEYSSSLEEWEYFLQDLGGVLQSYYDDLEPADGWHGREGKILLENDHAEVVVYAYYDLVSVNLVAKEGYDEEELKYNENWCAERVKKFRQLLHANFDCLELVGQFSNGEAVYCRVDYDEEAQSMNIDRDTIDDALGLLEDMRGLAESILDSLAEFSDMRERLVTDYAEVLEVGHYIKGIEQEWEGYIDDIYLAENSIDNGADDITNIVEDIMGAIHDGLEELEEERS